VAKRAIKLAEGSLPPPAEDVEFTQRFIRPFLSGPPWAQEVLNEYAAFIRDDLLGNLKKVVAVLDEHQLDNPKPPSTTDRS